MLTMMKNSLLIVCIWWMVLLLDANAENNVTECGSTIREGLDLVFVLDTSGSIRIDRFSLIRTFVEDIVKVLDIGIEEDKTLVGVILFATDAAIHFNLTKYIDINALLLAINPGLPYSRGLTYTNEALDLLRTSTLDGSMGLRDGRHHVAIVVTDGRSSVPSLTLSAASRLHTDTDFQVYAVGVNQALQRELEIIATDPTLTFHTNSFDAATLQQLQQSVTQTLCETCTYLGIQYANGEQIQPNCSSRCVCRNGEFHCIQQSCSTSGPTCYVFSNVHYRTFDQNNFYFKGNCEYVLTTPCGSDEFTVLLRNGVTDNNDSYIEQITVLISGENLEIVLGRGNGGTVSINGELRPNNGDGIILQSATVQVFRTGGSTHVLLAVAGITVSWDGNGLVTIKVSMSWLGKLCGLCGNYNNDATDDLQTPDGSLATTPRLFGNSWVHNATTSDTCAGVDTLPVCSGLTLFYARHHCTSSLQGGLFSSCNNVIDPTTYIENCELSYCNCNGVDHEGCACESIAVYAAACADAGVPPPSSWRNFLCSGQPQCDPGMVFQQCGSLCPQTCDSGTATCNAGCVEGCFCPDSQVLNNGSCIDCPENTTTGSQPGTGASGDPHFMVPLLSQEMLCYSVQGYPGLAFNLIYNEHFIVNAHFVDSVGDKSQATWIGKLAIIPRKNANSNAIIFDSVKQEVVMLGYGKFQATSIKQITYNKTERTSVIFTPSTASMVETPSISVVYTEPYAAFDVKFYSSHLDVEWKIKYQSTQTTNGIMGQFMTKMIDIDVQREMLIYSDGRNPVPVVRDVTMTGKPCWKAMNYGKQGEGLIKGNILDYVVSGILKDDFTLVRNH
ncbi:uncharacterized protein [Dysidea avara]